MSHISLLKVRKDHDGAREYNVKFYLGNLHSMAVRMFVGGDVDDCVKSLHDEIREQTPDGAGFALRFVGDELYLSTPQKLTYSFKEVVKKVVHRRMAIVCHSSEMQAAFEAERLADLDEHYDQLRAMSG